MAYGGVREKQNPHHATKKNPCQTGESQPSVAVCRGLGTRPPSAALCLFGEPRGRGGPLSQPRNPARNRPLRRRCCSGCSGDEWKVRRKTDSTAVQEQGKGGPGSLSRPPQTPHPNLLPLSATLTHKSSGPHWVGNPVYGYNVTPFRRLEMMRGASHCRLRHLTSPTGECHKHCPWRPSTDAIIDLYIDTYRTQRHCNSLDRDLPWFLHPVRCPPPTRDLPRAQHVLTRDRAASSHEEGNTGPA